MDCMGGKSTEDIVAEKEKVLQSILLRDSLETKIGYLLARHSDPGRAWNFLMVLFWSCF